MSTVAANVKSAPEKRARILEAARKRFSHYGYEKTTMCEIAADAGMSVGALYMFFKNKQDIVLAFGESCFNDFVQKMEAVCEKKLNAVDKLNQMMKTKSLVMKKFVEDSPHGGDILSKMQESGRNFCTCFADTEKKILERVIAQGIDEGTLYVENPARTAAAYYTAFTGYFPPHCLNKTQKEIEQGIEDLTDLLIKGLRAAKKD